MGTMAYMAPEQLHPGLDADQLADIFAFGDVFYELITGSHPFQAEDPGTIMYRITAAEPTPVRQMAPECPESVAYIIHQLLAKDRDILGVGVETVGTDAGQAGRFDPPFPNHATMHGNGKFGLASLCNLDQLPATGAVVIAAPLKIVDGSGSPLRVLAIAPA